MSGGAKSGKPYPNVRPSDKAVKKITARLTELTKRELACIPLKDVLANLNRSLRGWLRNRTAGLIKFPRRAETCMSDTGYTNHPWKPAGNRRMPQHEEHWKAVCGRTACTV